MRRFWKTTAALSALTLSAACVPGDPVYRGFYMEAGALDDPDFGSSIVHNTAIQSGEKQYRIDLASRFAAEVDTTVNFTFNSAQLGPEARETLDVQASWIRQFPEVRFKVYGHTDAVGSNDYNRQLGQRRANAVVAYLMSRGISRSRLEAVVSYGESQPLIVTDGRERRNRRTVTEVSGFIESHPTVMDGKYAAIVYREYVASGTAKTGLSSIKGSDFSTEK